MAGVKVKVWVPQCVVSLMLLMLMEGRSQETNEDLGTKQSVAFIILGGELTRC